MLLQNENDKKLKVSRKNIIWRYERNFCICKSEKGIREEEMRRIGKIVIS